MASIAYIISFIAKPQSTTRRVNIKYFRYFSSAKYNLLKFLFLRQMVLMVQIYSIRIK